MPKPTTTPSPFDFFPTPDPSRKRSIIHKSFSFMEERRILIFDQEEQNEYWGSAGKVETPTLMSCRTLYYFLAPEILNFQVSLPGDQKAGMDTIENEPWMDLLLAAPTVVYTPHVELGCRPARNTERLGRSLTFVRHLSLAAVNFDGADARNHEEKFYKALTKLRFIESLKMPKAPEKVESVVMNTITSDTFPNLETLEVTSKIDGDALDTLLRNTKRSVRNLSLSPRERLLRSELYGDKLVQSLSSHNCIRLKNLKIECLNITSENTLAPFAGLNSLETLVLDKMVISPDQNITGVRTATGDEDDAAHVALLKIVESFSFIRDGICRSVRFLKISFGSDVTFGEVLCLIRPRSMLFFFDTSDIISSSSSSSPSASAALYPQLQHFEVAMLSSESTINNSLLSIARQEIAPLLENLLLSQGLLPWERPTTDPLHDAGIPPSSFAESIINRDNTSSKLKRIHIPSALITDNNNTTSRDDQQRAEVIVERSIYQMLSCLSKLEELTVGELIIFPTAASSEEGNQSEMKKHCNLNNASLIARFLNFGSNIRELDFSSITAGDNFLRAVGQSANLRRTLEVLVVTCKNESAQGLRHLKDYDGERSWQNIECLCILSAKNISDKCAAEVVASISSSSSSSSSSLKQLNFSSCSHIGDEFCNALEQHTNLNSLILSNTAVTGKKISVFSKLHNLRELHFNDCTQFTDGSNLKPLESLGQLKTVSLYGTPLKIPKEKENHRAGFPGSSERLNAYITEHILPELFKRNVKIAT